MRIGELAVKTGVSVRALRYYEEQKLLYSARTAGGQREYPDSAVERVEVLQQLFAAGLPSKAIVTLLPCMITGVATPDMLERLAREHDRIAQQIALLSAAQTRLATVMTCAIEAQASPHELAQPAVETDRRAAT